MRWTTFEELLPTMTGFKQGVYERLAVIAKPAMDEARQVAARA